MDNANEYSREETHIEDLEKEEDLEKQGKRMVSVIVACVLAVCGVGFGVFTLMRSSQKDNQITGLNRKISEYENEIAALKGGESKEPTVDDGNWLGADGIYTVGGRMANRKYYLGITDLDSEKDIRLKDTYLIDTTKLGTKEGVVKYDLKTVLDKIAAERIAGLPEYIGEIRKSQCKTFDIQVEDPAYMISLVDWTIAADWQEALPLAIYMMCRYDEGYTTLSLGTELYSLNPETGEYHKIANL